MLETPHTLVGAAIAASATNPYLALGLSLASHFVLDYVPHWNPHLYKEWEKYGHPTAKSTRLVSVDSGLALVTGTIVAFSFLPDIKRTILVFACCVLAVLPDVIEIPFFYFGIKAPWLKKWVDFQRSQQGQASFWPGILVQAATTIAAIIAIWKI